MALNSNRSGEYFDFVQKGDGTYIIESINDNSLNEYRLYAKYDVNNETHVISEINNNLFNNIDHEFVIMVSKDLNGLSNGLFNNPKLTKINFTGSMDEWNALNLNVTIDIHSYECDEGFINYWDDVVRPTSESDICSMSKDEYLLLKEKYDNLNSEDKTYVNAYIDKANQSVEDTMDYLSKYYSDENDNKGNARRNLPQEMTIGIIVSVAIFGMTTISIFYILKQQKIIN